MTWHKRAFDIVVASHLIVIAAIAMVPLIIWLLFRSGRPLFFGQERMKTPNDSFTLWKLRTMTMSHTDEGVSGGDKQSRITGPGRFLRAKRLDEIPQLWNVLRGDISFVGPRPPLRTYVEQAPELYAQVLKSRPGITGLATLKFHRREETLLAACNSPTETDTVYKRRCVPRKARLDLIYQRHANFCFDLALMVETLLGVFIRGKS